MTDSDTAFPTEVYELIIDYAGQAIDVPFLRACALVCRSWYPRARYHLLRSVQLLNKSDVLSFVRMVRHDRGPMGLTNVKEMVNRLFIRGTEPNANEAQEGKKDEVVDVLRSRSRRSLVHLGTCAAMLAGRAKLYNLTYLGIADGEWKDMHRNVGLHLSAAFPRVQWVDLFNVKFRSTTDFGRFLCAFKSLVHLGFWVSPRRQAAFKDDQGAPFNPVTFTDVKALTNLKRLTLNGRYSTRKLAEYFIATGLATQFIELKLGYYEHIPLAEVAPLIGAATSLLGLDIALDRMDRDASAMQNAFEPTDILDLTPNTQLRFLMLRLQPGNLDWLYTLLRRVSAKTVLGITIIIDVRRPLVADSESAAVSMRDKLQQCLPPHLCTSIDKLFCAFEERHGGSDVQSTSVEVGVEGKNPGADAAASEARSLQYTYSALRIVQLALWIKEETMESVPDSEEWTALMRTRFPLLRARNMLMAVVVLEDSTDFLHER